jgi:hypothetical protein
MAKREGFEASSLIFAPPLLHLNSDFGRGYEILRINLSLFVRIYTYLVRTILALCSLAFFREF